MSDVDLIRVMSEKTNRKLGKEAFNEFANRYFNELNEICRVVCGDEEIGDEITNNVLLRVYKYPRFDPEKSPSSDIRKGILIWMTRMAQNEQADYYNIKKGDRERFEQYLTDCDTKTDFENSLCGEDQEIYSASSEEELRARKNLVESILSTLNENERVVYETYQNHRENGKYIVRGCKDEIAAKTGLSKASIGKIHQRALQKIQDAIGKLNSN